MTLVASIAGEACACDAFDLAAACLGHRTPLTQVRHRRPVEDELLDTRCGEGADKVIERIE